MAPTGKKGNDTELTDPSTGTLNSQSMTCSSTGSTWSPSCSTESSQKFSRSGGKQRRDASPSSSCSSYSNSSCSRRSTPRSIIKKKKNKNKNASRSSSASSQRSDQEKKTKKQKMLMPSNFRGTPKKSSYPIGEFKMLKGNAVKEEAREFLTEYVKQKEIEVFVTTVDGMPFVAVSLMSADEELRAKFIKVPPPTPMKKHTPGLNSPRKRLSNLQSSKSPKRRRNLSTNSKSVRFSDESSRKSKSKSPISSAEDHRELGEKVSDAMVANDRKYEKLWHDRAEE